MKGRLVIVVACIGAVLAYPLVRHCYIDKTSDVIIPNPTDVKFTDYDLGVKELNVQGLSNNIWFAKTSGKSFSMSMVMGKNAFT